MNPLVTGAALTPTVGQQIGAALSQAGTLLNPGTYTTNPITGAVTYYPTAGANVPGGLPTTSGTGLAAMDPTTLLILAALALFMFSGKK